MIELTLEQRQHLELQLAIFDAEVNWSDRDFLIEALAGHGITGYGDRPEDELRDEVRSFFYDEVIGPFEGVGHEVGAPHPDHGALILHNDDTWSWENPEDIS